MYIHFFKVRNIELGIIRFMVIYNRKITLPLIILSYIVNLNQCYSQLSSYIDKIFDFIRL